MTARREAGVPASPLGYYWGDDAYSLDAAAAALGRRVSSPDGAPLTRWRVAGGTVRPADIMERVATATMFGGGTLAIVDEPAPLLRSKAERDALVGCLDAVAPGNALAFLEADDGGGRRARASEDLAAAVAAAGGEVRQLVAPREGAMARWITERAAERGMQIEAAAAELLARKVGAFVREGDVDRRRQGQLAVAELEKLAVARLDGPIRRDDVEALVADAVPGSTWALLDAVGGRRPRDAATLMERVLEVSPEPVVLAVLHRRIRELIQVADHRTRGVSIQETARSLHLKEYPARKLWDQAASWSTEELDAALEGLLDLDAALKGEAGADARRRRLAFTLWLATHVGRA